MVTNAHGLAKGHGGFDRFPTKEYGRLFFGYFKPDDNKTSHMQLQEYIPEDLYAEFYHENPDGSRTSEDNPERAAVLYAGSIKKTGNWAKNSMYNDSHFCGDQNKMAPMSYRKVRMLPIYDL